jgi:hypothetical protein
MTVAKSNNHGTSNENVLLGVEQEQRRPHTRADDADDRKPNRHPARQAFELLPPRHTDAIARRPDANRAGDIRRALGEMRQSRQRRKSKKRPPTASR